MPSILLSDNGVSSGSAGLKSVAASDGSLALQTTTAGGTATTAVTIDTSQNVGVGTASPSQRLHVVSSGTTPVNLVGATACQINLNDGTQNANWGLGVGGVGITGIASPSTYPLVLYTNGAERMRLDSSGNLGLGVTPNVWLSNRRVLQIGGNTVAAVSHSAIIGESIYNLYYNSGGSTLYQNTGPAAVVDFNNRAVGGFSWNIAASGTAGNAVTLTQAMTLDASGNLLVGTTSANARLTVSGGGGYAASIENSTTNNNVLLVAGTASSNAQNYIVFAKAGTATGSINYNGTTVFYSTFSDYRLKNITSDLIGYKERVMSLQPKQGTWISNGSEFRGFLAHEFQNSYSSSVMGEKDAVDENGNPVMQAMQAGSAEVIADLVALLQEQQAIIEQLKARLDAANL